MVVHSYLAHFTCLYLQKFKPLPLLLLLLLVVLPLWHISHAYIFEACVMPIFTLLLLAADLPPPRPSPSLPCSPMSKRAPSLALEHYSQHSKAPTIFFSCYKAISRWRLTSKERNIMRQWVSSPSFNSSFQRIS